jgi:hypothetical protein
MAGCGMSAATPDRRLSLQSGLLGQVYEGQQWVAVRPLSIGY